MALWPVFGPCPPRSPSSSNLLSFLPPPAVLPLPAKEHPLLFLCASPLAAFLPYENHPFSTCGQTSAVCSDLKTLKVPHTLCTSYCMEFSLHTPLSYVVSNVFLRISLSVCTPYIALELMSHTLSLSRVSKGVWTGNPQDTADSR